jgi:hypothetical protein
LRGCLLPILLNFDGPVALKVEYGERTDIANPVHVQCKLPEKVDNSRRTWREREEQDPRCEEDRK